MRRPFSHLARSRVPQGYHPVVWVRTGERVAMRTEPGGGASLVEMVGRRTRFGSPSVFGVEQQKDGWVGVTTPSSRTTSSAG